MSQKAIVIYSGGLDSFTALFWAREQGYDVRALSVDYGQRHRKEINAAAFVCGLHHISHRVVDLRSVGALLSGSALTSPDVKVPEGHYAAESMKATVVPNRNMILLSVAIGAAVAQGANAVVCGVHAGDHAIYPDCRPEFIYTMQEAACVGNNQLMHLETPFLRWYKADILAWGLRRKLEYALTWTCYNGREKACGRCGACVERLESFKLNGTVDPIEYEPELPRNELAQ